MTEIDSAAFEAGEASCNFSQDNLSAAGSSTAAHFSDPLGRVYVTAQARLLSARPQAGHTQPALTLVVEDSADGSSWATVATFDFTASDQQSAAVDSPRAYLRASWADVVGTWAVDVAVKSIATPASGGGSTPFATATVTLTDAQIKALPTTPIEIVPAPGTGKVLVPLLAWLHLSWVADYTNIGGSSHIGFEYGSTFTSSLAPFVEAAGGGVTNLLADGASHAAYTGPQLGVAGAGTEGVGQFLDDPDPINAALNLLAVNDGGDFTGGNVGNSLKVTVYYATFTN